ncbi:helix-turn-helix domain-containing protein [Mycobacterium sp. 852013-50091_SCH5140682]|uniref:TetR/AcrR family transcriptional regulator n=1 Tax=Mycobacterium sp. 852013-50091_SCH5140682 TaxID=1834109 RepID=UPI000A55CAFD|nr:helix-turn-helix domain-containing protein [Mycobacterium sp. 852013-50091_SCH5140682]
MVKGDSRERLVAVATELFGEQGYHKTGTEEIVRRSGVTRGSLYHHFADKEALFEEVFDRADQVVSARLGRLPRRSAGRSGRSATRGTPWPISRPASSVCWSRVCLRRSRFHRWQCC